MNEPKIGFIGTGNLASAIIGGVTRSGYIKQGNIFVCDTNKDKAQSMAATGVEMCADAKALAQACDFIFLTVKPQVYDVVLNDIKKYIISKKCLIDVAAGITIDYVKNTVGKDCKVIRVMPNTPLLYGEGATAIVKREPVTEKEFQFIKGAFDSCGITCVVDESDIDAVIAASGSSPAFVFRFARELIRYATDAGLSPENAKRLVVSAIKGSARMIEESPLTPDDLIRMVASPNGTTEAGLRSMDESGFDEAVYSAAAAAKKRSEELRK